MDMVIELRNYLLRPRARDAFIEYFKKHFIESQEELGAHIPALFRIKDEPDRFFWIRQFDSMRERSWFLPAFYGGDVWKEFGPAANDMMLEWHCVHLVKPLDNGEPAFSSKKGIWAADFYTAKEDNPAPLTELFIKDYIPVLNQWGINSTSLFVSELTENDFPRLPVYQEKSLLLVLTNFDSEQEYKSTINRLNRARNKLIEGLDRSIKEKKSVVLYPT